jgi:hypothetical protein
MGTAYTEILRYQHRKSLWSMKNPRAFSLFSEHCSASCRRTAALENALALYRKLEFFHRFSD